MNKRPLIALSVLGAIVLTLSLGSAGNVRAQDPTPTVIVQPSSTDAESLMPQSPQQPAATTGTPLGTTMSYQGQLQKSGGAYNGTCNFQFSLWDAATGGAQVGSTIAKSNATVTNGLFSVELAFGDAFTGDARWLQTAMQCTGDASFTTLSPRQSMNAVPYALGLWAGISVRGSHPSAVFTADNKSGAGLAGYSSGNAGNSWGVFGYSQKEHGVRGSSENGSGGFFTSKNGIGLVAASDGHHGVQGISHAGSRYGVYGLNDTSEPYAAGVAGEAPNGNGVFGVSQNHAGGYFVSANGYGIFAGSGASYAAYIDGKMRSTVVEIAGGSDLAERFSQADGSVAEPGTVMVIDPDHPGQIKPSAGAYDRKVAGIVSGAGDIRPGLTLHQEGVAEGDTVMAIAGRVYVKAEALSGPIEPGDLLTTSDLPGYAMKASDDARSHGAVIGKAMTGLKDGKGLVLVIVNLQ